MSLIHKVEDWSYLDPKSRADLLTVIENIRPGANIELNRIYNETPYDFEPQKNMFKKIMYKLGMIYTEYDTGFFVAGYQSWMIQLLNSQINHGQFLGYPMCCIHNFEKGCDKFLETQNIKFAPGVVYNKYVKKAIETGNFREELLYSLHIPCSITCAESINLAIKVKECLERKDPAAALALSKTNKDNIKILGSRKL